ncbi:MULTISPECIES: purine-cytosine permease family protein [Halomonas]|uniref:purine-cytosine permease family protein n=1 Tax=Halomonas TaxID=2745 RepID=UPI0015E68285|nr:MULTISPECIES: allantoin permease [Halomonas]
MASPPITEHRASEAQEDADRMSRSSLMMAWWAVLSAIFYLVVAAAMARSYGTANALIGIVMSILVYSAINAVLSRFAQRTGLTVAEFSRTLFGRLGALVATLIFFATALYYAVFEGYVMALALSHQSGWPMALTTLVVVIVGIALIGAGVQRFLDRFNAWLLPVYLLGMLAAVWLAIDGYGYPEGWLTRVPEGGAPAFGWWHTFTYYMGIWVLMMFTFDYARFGKDRDRRFHARITFGLPFYALAFGFSAVVGILLDATLPTAGLSEAAIVMGLLELMGLAGLVLVWVTQSRINTANYFLATSNLASLLGQWRPGKACYGLAMALVAALAWALMSADVFGYLLTALAYQGIFVVAWVGVALSHILSRAARETAPASVEEDEPVYRLAGLGAWAGACLVGVVLMHQPTLTSFSAPATFLLAFTLSRLLPGGSIDVAGLSPSRD